MAAAPAANHTAALAEAENQHVLHTLIQEAQQEIGRLRAELYSTSRLADERKQALDATTAARDQLAAVAHQLEEKVQVMHSQLMQLPQLQHELKVLHEQQQHVEKDRAVQLQARRILESELQDERAARAAAEEARAKAEADRSRLHLGQDDLAAQVRLLKQKVADAEEEQLRAEEEAAQLRQEVAQQQQQQQLAGGAVGNASAGAAGSARDSAARSRAAEEGLRTAQLEAQAAKAEAARLQQELQAVKQQAQHTQTQLQAQLHELAQQQQQHGKQPPLHTHAAAASQEQQQQLVTELASCREQISTLQQTLSAAEAAVAAAKMEAAAARAEAGKAAAAAARGGAALVSAAGAVGNGSDAEAEALQEQIELLMDKVVTLKKSRDKLLEQLDGQSVEMEQLLAEHQAMSASSAEARQECRNWQAQTQDALVTISRLQELLSEAAGQQQQQQQQPNGQANTDELSVEEAVPPEQEVAKLRAAMLQQQVQVTTLELQVKVLSTQLLRSHAAYKQASSSFLPLLSGVEARLLSLKARTGSLMA